MKVKYDLQTGRLVRKDEGDHVIFYYYDSVSGQLIRRRIARSTENAEAIEGDLLKNKIHGAIH